MSAVALLLFALLGFAIAGPALVAAFAAAHLWMAATIVLRLGAGAYVKAVLWFLILAALVQLDVSWLTLALTSSAASAQQVLPQTCELHMELKEQTLHIARQCGPNGQDSIDRGVLTITRWRGDPTCTPHINAIERTDRTAYLVRTNCGTHLSTLQFELVSGNELTITNVENY